MISQGIIVKDNKVLMVKQYSKSGDIIWTFPGGHIKEGESPSSACIRETLEETGYTVDIIQLLHSSEKKFTYLCRILHGNLFLDNDFSDNEDMIDVSWVDLTASDIFDHKTQPLVDIYLRK